jgi:predicted Zn finger-like uncharacterized protein
MLVNCPNCKKEYTINQNQYIQSRLVARCGVCGDSFKVQLESNQKIICPNCNFNQLNNKECQRCGIIFDKFKNNEKKSSIASSEAELTKAVKADKALFWKKAWLVVSILYFIIVVIDCILVLPSERNRPLRDRLGATIDLVEYSYFLQQVTFVQVAIEDMIDRRSRKSHIYYFFEDSCRKISPGIRFRKSNPMIKAIFPDGTVLKYVDRDSTVYLKKKNIPNNHQFSFFPSLKALHTNYKEIDYEGEADKLQTGYGYYLDFSKIEEKYQSSMKWLVPRFILFYFLIWFIPVFLAYFLFRMIGYYRSF